MQTDVQNISISTAVSRFINGIELSRSPKTARTYLTALNSMLAALTNKKIDILTAPVNTLTEDVISWLSVHLKTSSPATERLYLTAVARFFEFLAAEKLADVNLPRVRLLIRMKSRRPGLRLPQFPKDSIEKIIQTILNQVPSSGDDKSSELRYLRDRAFLVTLADTGLRVHEACALHRGDIDWNEGQAIIIGKGDRQAVVRFSTRSLTALNQYLLARSELDGSTGKPLGSLPLFARHDKGAGNHIKTMTPTTGRNIVAERVLQILGPESVGKITPHSFRHYFVTKVLQSSGNLKLAQELARHRNIAVTQRYAHLSDNELNEGYFKVFDEE
jgi:integrase/recombinase XerC